MNTRKVPETPLTCEVRAALEEYTQRLMNIYPERFIESDPEAWRDEYRKKQAAGVKFERLCCDGEWEGAEANGGPFNFTLEKEDYREVPQEVSGAEYARAEPHAAERALWKAQREAGTNEVWRYRLNSSLIWHDVPIDQEPEWISTHEYEVKPMKLTARIVRNIPMTFREYETRLHDWEFFGTREEYIAEGEKYGYFVTGKIKEVVEKPKMVTHYFALYKTANGYITSISGHAEDWVNEWITDNGHTIIGDIEEREVEA